MGRGELSPEIFMIEICHYMNWDFWTFSHQPDWFIELIAMKISVDNEFSEIKINQMKNVR